MVAAVFLCLPARAANFSSSVSARSAILVDAQTGRVLYEKNADEQSLIASTTKIMTGLLVCEAGSWSAKFPCRRRRQAWKGPACI